MKTILKSCSLALALALAPLHAMAAGSGFPLDSVSTDHSNLPSLQRGAKTFVNYCMGCHSAAYHRYSRMAADLGMSDEQVRENLIFTTDKNGEPTKVGSLMTNTMDADYARRVFGVVPPNLSLISRSRGADWLYTYMRTFYQEPGRTGIGANNLVFENVGMPHVLWELQGWQEPVYEVVTENGTEVKQFVEFKQVTEGTLSAEEYDMLIRDLVNFLDYLGDPIKRERHRIGFWVMLFLGLFFAFAYMLKREYWRDVH
ncbi:MAG: cytochrome c1 [Pseudomonadota bacterium]